MYLSALVYLQFMTNLQFLFRPLLLLCVAMLIHTVLYPQSLSFTTPVVLKEGVKTDQAVDITHFKNNFFFTWRDMTTGSIRYSFLGENYNGGMRESMVVPNAFSAYGSIFTTIDERLYLLWISKEGNIEYIINNSDSGFNTSNVYTLPFARPVSFTKGLSAGSLGAAAMLATHSVKKNEMICCLLHPGTNGLLVPGVTINLPAKSEDYPCVIALNQTVVRYCWRDKKEGIVRYCDYSTGSQQWKQPATVAAAQTAVTPALCHTRQGGRQFYIWRGTKKDNQLYYANAALNETPGKQTALPPYFKSDVPVAICSVNEDNLLMAFTGTDNQVYISRFTNYDPSRWMENLLHSSASDKSLQDIVIPGSHDAGMSVLTAAGGQQPGTINECNTLTQKLPVSRQLVAGIRMCDLRAGTFNGYLYTKHCAADCMADAIGGAYGENLRLVCTSIRQFLQENTGEIILLSFSHFCEKETPVSLLTDSLLQYIGRELVYTATAAPVGKVPLRQLAGKVIISFETAEPVSSFFPTCTIADSSTAFINFKRSYAATNDIKILLEKEKLFFQQIMQPASNDLVRLDWQITQSASEAPTICNDFEDDKISPVVNSVMLLANVIKGNKSIVEHAIIGNNYLPATVNEWIQSGVINRGNKPHILYVDVAGEWITDYCIDLNRSELYR